MRFILWGLIILSCLSPALAQFETRSANAAPQIPFSLAVGDFNRDGRLDMAVASTEQTTNDVVVFLGNGDGTFKPPAYYSGGSNPGSIVAADFRGNGLLTSQWERMA
jgi:hypothetical protein